MVLEDHIRRKRRLIPPLRDALGDSYLPFSWSVQIVPEIFWITLLIDELGAARGVEVARQVALAASQAHTDEPKPLFAAISSFDILTPKEKEQFLGIIEGRTLVEFRNSVGKISALWPQCPFSFIGLETECNPQDVLQYLSPTLEKLYDRRSREGTLAISTAVYLGLDQGKLKIAKDVFDRNSNVFSDIESYPETEASKKAGSFFRAMGPMLLLSIREQEETSDWVDVFWNGLSMLGGCIGQYQDVPVLPEVVDGIEGFITAFTHFAHRDFRSREDAWKLELGKVQERQVILSLMARQTTLAIEIVANPGVWNSNIAPILLRAMADVHITLVWIMKNAKLRVPLYVQDGLGAIKLEIAHRKSELKKNGTENDDEHNRYTTSLENWLELQQLEFLTEINFGSWSGKNTRAMAEEAGSIDFYNYVFQPFSSAVHSYWSHVGRINSEMCENPAHHFHFLPVIPSFAPDFHWCHLAGKYLAKTFSSYDDFLGKNDLGLRSYGIIQSVLEGSAGVTTNDSSASN